MEDILGVGHGEVDVTEERECLQRRQRRTHTMHGRVETKDIVGRNDIVVQATNERDRDVNTVEIRVRASVKN